MKAICSASTKFCLTHICCRCCCCSLLQRELRLKDKERALLAERAALLEQQAVQQARDAALETLQLKYHLCAQKIKE